MKVLIVEDSAEIAALLKIVLSHAGHEIEVKTDSFSSIIDLTFWNEIDVAIIDQHLDGYDGKEILRWLKQNKPSIRRIMLTGDSSIDAVNANAHIVLIKPVSPHVIQGAVDGR